MKPALSAILLLVLLTGCATKVWYQPGKTAAEAQASYAHATIVSIRTIDPNGLGMNGGQTRQQHRLLAASMRSEGYVSLPAKDIPNGKAWPED